MSTLTTPSQQVALWSQQGAQVYSREYLCNIATTLPSNIAQTYLLLGYKSGEKMMLAQSCRRPTLKECCFNIIVETLQ